MGASARRNPVLLEHLGLPCTKIFDSSHKSPQHTNGRLAGLLAGWLARLLAGWQAG